MTSLDGELPLREYLKAGLSSPPTQKCPPVWEVPYIVGELHLVGHTCWAERTCSCVSHICPPQISPVKLPEMEPQEPLFPKSEVSTSYPAS